MKDWKLARRILRYLMGTRNLKLHYVYPAARSQSTQAIQLPSYSDADFAGEKADRKSVSGGVLLLEGMAIGWLCKKQGAVALSTMEAEFVSASECGRSLLGLRETVQEIGLRVTKPMVTWMDNQAAIKQVESENRSAKSRHIDVKLKFLKDFAEKSVITPRYVATGYMIADLLTKELPSPAIVKLVKIFGLKPRSESEIVLAEREGVLEITGPIS
jgi:hypothetical protein